MAELRASTHLYTPLDVLEANAAWGAACGPAALAALLGEPVMGLQSLFPKPWTTPTVMKAALAQRQRRFWIRPTLNELQGRGLAFIQLQGPWDAAPERVQYQHTHWIAFAELPGPARVRFAYDVNGGPPGVQGGWEPFTQWESRTLRTIIQRHPQASGLWRVRLTLELHP